MNLRHATKTRAVPPDAAVRGRVLPAMAMAMAMAGAAVSGGCGGNSAPHGSPVLTKVFWQVKTAQILIWAPDQAASPPVPAAPTQINLVFDRVLDGSKIEDTITVNGVTGPQAKSDPPVKVCWPQDTVCYPLGSDAATATGDAGSSGGPPIDVAVWYNSQPLMNEAAGSAFIYVRETPSYPSSTPITLTLDKLRITGQYGDPMTGPASIPVMTEAFLLTDLSQDLGPAGDGGATSTLPQGNEVPVNYWVPLQFNNRPTADQAILAQYIHVTNASDGAHIDFVLVPDPQDATLLYIQPPPRQIWTNGAHIAVTIDADLPDVFGETLGVTTRANFVACERMLADGAAFDCSSPAGGGAIDGGTADASVPDAGIDAPSDGAGIGDSDADALSD